MASTQVLLLQLLLVSLASASHLLGGSLTFTYKGKNPDGTFRMVIRNRATFSRCGYHNPWNCYSGHCGSFSSPQKGIIDQSYNTPLTNYLWCETEKVTSRNVPSDKPFEMRLGGCCWSQTRNWVRNWRLQTQIDLGSRSDTGKPNRSPDIAILPMLRVPQNCPRTYRLMSSDPDGDKVRCRYGNIRNIECDTCIPPSGFVLDQDSCLLHYNYSNAHPIVNAFELVVEDFPQRPISLAYTDGSQSYKSPLIVRRNRPQSFYTPFPTTSALPTTQWSWYRTFRPTTRAPTTAEPTTVVSTTASPTTRAPTTTEPTTVVSTTARPTTRAPTTTEPTTVVSTTARPTTRAPTTAAPTTVVAQTTIRYTTQAPTTSTLPYTTSGHLHGPTPLSKLPLQFSLLVDPPAPSCLEGLYLPKFVHPTPENGASIQAEVNKEVQIRVKAEATYATIQDIIISGPLNISKHRTTHNEFMIRWTPVQDDLGDHYPICFAVESVTASAVATQATYYYTSPNPSPSSQYAIYQSEMRCVLVDIHNTIVKSHVICNESTMRVEVIKSSFPGLHEDHLRLNNPSNTACSLQRHSNSTHIIAVIPLNACGTLIEEDDENLIFKNEITTVDNIQDQITRNHLLEVQFYCQYPKRGNMTLGFTAHRRMVTVWDKGFGTFTYQFEFFPNNQFRTMIDPNSYPLEYDVRERIYMQIEATSSLNNTELFVESCSAAPYDTPNYWPTYSIIENGCTVDQTVEVYNTSNPREFKFSMEAFKFIGLHDQVYISCSILMCEAGSYNTRCSQGCINTPSLPGGQPQPRKREAVTQSSRHFVSQGPLRLKRSAESTRSSVVNLNLNLVFVVGGLLAAVGMISVVLLYKAEKSRVKYQPLPTCES